MAVDLSLGGAELFRQPALLCLCHGGGVQLSLDHAAWTSSALPRQVVGPTQALHGPSTSTPFRWRLRSQTSSWPWMVTWGTNTSTDPGCSRALNPDMVHSNGVGQDSRGLSRQAVLHACCICSSASLHSAQNHFASLPLHYIVAHGHDTRLPAPQGSWRASAPTHS